MVWIGLAQPAHGTVRWESRTLAGAVCRKGRFVARHALGTSRAGAHVGRAVCHRGAVAIAAEAEGGVGAGRAACTGRHILSAAMSGGYGPSSKLERET